MPGYEPFLLCDFHVHTTWSDGTLSLRDIIDHYGASGRFDVMAVTDHILMKTGLAGAGRARRHARAQAVLRRRRRLRRLSRRHCRGVSARLARYRLLVIPGAEVTQNHLRGRRNSHIIALGLTSWISADQTADEILREIRRQDALSIACHPHHRTTSRLEISTCYLWDHRHELADLVDVWEAANRDDLFSVTSLKHYPYVASSDFHKAKHLYSWKTLLRCEKSWPAVKAALKANRDVALMLYRREESSASAAALDAAALVAAS